MTIETIIVASTQLLEKLRKRVKDKETFDIVRDIQARQSELEEKAKAAEAEVTRLSDEIAALKARHADEIAKLNDKHALEIQKLRQPPPSGIWDMSDLGDPL
ncbi:MAG TPA: hypothetical protein VGK72_04085 [Chthoniobacterales bacterium]